MRLYADFGNWWILLRGFDITKRLQSSLSFFRRTTMDAFFFFLSHFHKKHVFFFSNEIKVIGSISLAGTRAANLFWVTRRQEKKNDDSRIRDDDKHTLHLHLLYLHLPCGGSFHSDGSLSCNNFRERLRIKKKRANKLEKRVQTCLHCPDPSTHASKQVHSCTTYESKRRAKRARARQSRK